MKVVVFHGSPKKGNTFLATTMFMDELSKCGDVHFTEFFLPAALPAFCTGCTLCFRGLHTKCPNAQHLMPILDAIAVADALLFATPHYGTCSMTGAMKNLLDHLDFMVLAVSPRIENFGKKAFVITTGAGSSAAAKPIVKVLKRWGINRVCALGITLRADKWDKMPKTRQVKYEKQLRRSARQFHKIQKGCPHLYTVVFYHMSKFVLKKYVGAGNYPYELWKKEGYFNRRPF